MAFWGQLNAWGRKFANELANEAPVEPLYHSRAEFRQAIADIFMLECGRRVLTPAGFNGTDMLGTPPCRQQRLARRARPRTALSFRMHIPATEAMQSA
jgi:hypothetical protein